MISVPHGSTLLGLDVHNSRSLQEFSSPTPTSLSSTRSPRTRSPSAASSGDSPIVTTWLPATRRVRRATSSHAI
jgi:hypothetical protein